MFEGFKSEDLLGVMMGEGETKNPQFGCNQVVIVRNQAAKAKLPVFLQQALCLTVYEAKGLEFDDVILYNFFTDSTALNQWRLVGDLQCSTRTRKKLKFEDELTLNELDFEEYKKLI